MKQQNVQKQSEGKRKESRFRTERLVLCAVFAAAALLLSYVEALFPLTGLLQGFKLGLANSAVLLALYTLGFSEAWLVNCVRILLAGILFGTPVSMGYAIVGGVLSLLVMALLKKTNRFSMVGVSMAGSVAHNLGQVAVASCVMGTPKIWTLFPALGLAGLLFGSVVGLLALGLEGKLRPALRRWGVLCLALVVATVTLTGCQSKVGEGTSLINDAAKTTSEKATQTLFLMDTAITYTVYGETEEAAESYGQAIEETFRRIDRLADRHSDTSEVAGANKAAMLSGFSDRSLSFDLSEDVAAMVALGAEWSEKTDGALNLFLGTAIDIWNRFRETDDPAGYLEKETQGLQTLSEQWKEAALVQRENGTYQITPSGVILDLGAIAKGYAAEEAAKAAKALGCTSGMIDAGGNIVVIGSKPNGSPWRIGIADPQAPEQNKTIVEVSDTSLVTSGDYQRYRDYEGVRYCHILDPSTGYPAGVDPKTGEQTARFCSVTVRCNSSAIGDALSTALFVMGPQKAEPFAEQLAAEGTAEAFFVYEDGTVFQTAGW